MDTLLQTLAREPHRDVDPLGLLPSEAVPPWEHIRYTPVEYDRLRMQEEGGPQDREEGRAAELWLGLAQSALARSGGETSGSAPGGTELARSIRSHDPDEQYDRVIVDYLHRLAIELKSTEGHEAKAIRDQVDRLVRGLDEPTLKRLLGLGDPASQRRFLLDVTQSLAVQSVIRILKAAASSSEQTISNSLTRLLSKLSLQAETGTEVLRAEASTALQENVEELIQNWELRDPNPGQYTLVLDAMARAAPLSHPSVASSGASGSGAMRLVQMSLEVDSWGPVVARAAEDLLDQGLEEDLVSLLAAAPADSSVVRELWSLLARPDRIETLLAQENLDEGVLQTVGGQLSPEAISILLDVLSESESRSVRRRAFDLLAHIGVGVEAALVARLDDSRWYVVRNLLALAQRLERVPTGVDMTPFLEHEDSRVRKEALLLAVRDPALREWALEGGLVDIDDHVVRIALLEIQEVLPESLVSVVANRVVGEPLDSELRVLGVRALKNTRSSVALDALVNVCSPGRTLLRRRRLNAPSAEVLAGLKVLAEVWAGHPTAREILQAARRSKDLSIRSAVQEREGS
jgi:hypothetical protein